jgi:hypothetical protein
VSRLTPFIWNPRIIVRSCQVAMTGPAHCPPSDHYAVVADLEIDATALGGGRGLDAWNEVAAELWPAPRISR